MIVLEQKLATFASKPHTTKTNLVKPCILRLVEDLEDNHHASIALKEKGSISFAALEKELKNVAN